jgi:serine/threonine-protein kinase
MITLDHRFKLKGRLPSRGIGQLWLADDDELSREVLVRRIDRSAAAEARVVDSLLVACYALSQIRHPNIEEVLTLREDQRRNVYIVYGYRETVSLRRILLNYDRLHPDDRVALHIIGQAASGLAAAHSARERWSNQPWRLYHLALTPENLRLTRTGDIQVADFAIAATMKERTVAESAYFAPEVLEGGDGSAAADIFSLGVIGYEIITGRSLFGQQTVPEVTTAILKRDYDLSALRQTAADTAAVEVIEQSLQPDPASRFKTAASLADRIQGLTKDLLPSPRKRVAG